MKRSRVLSQKKRDHVSLTGPPRVWRGTDDENCERTTVHFFPARGDSSRCTYPKRKKKIMFKIGWSTWYNILIFFHDKYHHQSSIYILNFFSLLIRSFIYVELSRGVNCDVMMHIWVMLEKFNIKEFVWYGAFNIY